MESPYCEFDEWDSRLLVWKHQMIEVRNV